MDVIVQGARWRSRSAPRLAQSVTVRDPSAGAYALLDPCSGTVVLGGELLDFLERSGDGLEDFDGRSSQVLVESRP